MNRTLFAAVLALLVNDAVAGTDTAAIDARIRTAVAEIDRVAVEVSRLRAELAQLSSSVAPAPSGRTGGAGESTAPTPGQGTSAESLAVQLIAQIAAAEAQLAQLQLELTALLRAARFANSNQKPNQSYNLLSGVLKSLNEMRSGTARNGL